MIIFPYIEFLGLAGSLAKNMPRKKLAKFFQKRLDFFLQSRLYLK